MTNHLSFIAAPTNLFAEILLEIFCSLYLCFDRDDVALTPLRTSQLVLGKHTQLYKAALTKMEVFFPPS